MPKKKKSKTKFNIEINYFEEIRRRVVANEYISGDFLCEALRNDNRTKNIYPEALKLHSNTAHLM